VVEDEALMWELIRACPFQEHWSPVINDHGAYFCEIGATQDRILHGGRHAWPVKPGWWDKRPEDFEDQVQALCVNCSGCLPMPAFSDGRGGRDGPTKDAVSARMLEKLKAVGSPKAMGGHTMVWEKKLTHRDIERWQGRNPRAFRSFEAHRPEDVEKALAAKDRAACGPVAPPDGLYLLQVDYE